MDANGGYDRQEALAFAEAFADLGVSGFEEPVWHTDFDGLRHVRDWQGEPSASGYGAALTPPRIHTAPSAG